MKQNKLKEGGGDTIEYLKILFDKCPQEEDIPDVWNESLTILTFKKGGHLT